MPSIGWGKYKRSRFIQGKAKNVTVSRQTNGLINDDVLRWILIVSFAAMAVWMLIPDKLDDDEGMSTKFQRFGVFGTVVVLFFLAEMGDKTQIATVAMAAYFEF